MERRELLKHGATAVAGGAAGYGLLQTTSENAQASVTMGDLSISDASKTTEDGTIAGVTVNVDGSWQYDLPAGKSPHRWTVTLSVTDGETVEQVAQQHDQAKYLRSNGEWSLSGSVTDTDLYTTSDFAAPEGKIKTVTIGFVVVFKVASESGDVLAAAELSDTGSVEVTNEAYNATEYGSASGSGGLTIKT